MKQRYDSYKPSGIEWIGEIPSHWKYIPVKYFFYLKGRIGWQGLKADEFKDDGPHLVTGTDFENGRVNWEKCYRITEERFNEAPEIHVKEGDLLITKDGTVGKLVYIEDKPEKVSLNSHLLIIRPLKDFISNKYIFWYCHSKIFKDYSGLIQDGSIMASLSQEDFSNFRVLVPPLSEQEGIAAWLDEKCGEIDAAIAKVDREIELIDELKQSEISRVVTRGLNPNAPLRPSGIDWIGEIPEHWKLKRLRFICEFRNGYTPSKDNKDYWTDGVIPWYRMEDIRESGRFLKEAKQYITEEAVKGGGLFEAGSFILATTATIGEHAMLIVDSLANQQFTNLKIRKSLKAPVISAFFFYYLYVIDEFCKSSTKISTFPAMNMEDLRNFNVTLPPFSEQREIADYLDKKCAKIDGLKAKLKKKREALIELRQSMISEVVTGKRKVV